MNSENERVFMPVNDRRFRVLSLDGGGIKGTFAAAFLAGIEDLTSKSVVAYFDLIAGTSTGGIIAIALALGLSAHDILEFYVDRGPDIFRVTGLRRQKLRHLFRAKHSAERLRQAVQEVFGARRLGDAQTRLVIPAYDATSGDIRLFKTAHHPRFKSDYRMYAWEAALATSAAPTYLPGFVQGRAHRYVDGGVWANNPAAVAVNEAVGVLGANPRKLEVLSIGTTVEPFHIPEGLASAGLLRWGLTGVKLLTQAQQQGAAGLAHAMTDHSRRLVRINETTAEDRFRLDDSTGIPDLRALGNRAAAHAEKDIGPRFLDEPAPAFEPYYS